LQKDIEKSKEYQDVDQTTSTVDKQSTVEEMDQEPSSAINEVTLIAYFIVFLILVG